MKRNYLILILLSMLFIRCSNTNKGVAGLNIGFKELNQEFKSFFDSFTLQNIKASCTTKSIRERALTTYLTNEVINFRNDKLLGLLDSLIRVKTSISKSNQYLLIEKCSQGYGMSCLLISENENVFVEIRFDYNIKEIVNEYPGYTNIERFKMDDFCTFNPKDRDIGIGSLTISTILNYESNQFLIGGQKYYLY